MAFYGSPSNSQRFTDTATGPVVYQSPSSSQTFTDTATGSNVRTATVLSRSVTHPPQSDVPLVYAAAPQQRQPQYDFPSFAPAPQSRQPHIVSSTIIAQSPQKSGLPLTKEGFRGMGVLLLLVVCILPVWDAVALIEDINYSYWVGPNLPLLVIAGCMLLIFVFIAFTETSFGRIPLEQQTTQTLATIVSSFMTLLGLGLVLTSFPISYQANAVHANLEYTCGTHQDTIALRDHYVALLSLRTQDDCASKFSVVDCDGYQAVEPHTAYLQAMETEFRCSGFCYNPSAAAGVLQTNASSGVATAVGSGVAARPKETVEAALLQLLSAGTNETVGTNETAKAAAATTGNSMLQKQQLRYIGSALDVHADTPSVETPLGTASKYPPNLFTNANSKISCDGAASRQIINFAREMGYDSWYIGICLIAISVVMGLWEWKAIAEK